MKTTKKWSKMLSLSMAAMVLAFGLVIVGCGGDSSPNLPTGSPGTITISNFPTIAAGGTFSVSIYKNATVTTTDATMLTDLSFAGAIDSAEEFICASSAISGTFTMPITLNVTDGIGPQWSGSGTYMVVVSITAKDPPPYGSTIKYKTDVTFANNTGTVDWNEMTYYAHNYGY